MVSIPEPNPRAIGVSIFSARQFDHLRSHVPVATSQIELSPFQLDLLENDALFALQLARVAPSPRVGGRLLLTAGAKGTRRAFTRTSNLVNFMTQGWPLSDQPPLR
jgi:predicted oxidoreductase